MSGGVVNLRKKLAALAAVLLAWMTPISSVPTAGVAGEPSSLSSLSVVMLEPQSGRVLFQRDAHTPRPMASTTKLMTALIAVESVPFDREVVIPEEAVRVEGSSMGLRAGDHITMHDLVTGLLLESGNDAANAIALLVSGSLPAFAEKMNRKAEELGMQDSTFVTPSGLDEGNHSSSAYDMALLGAEVLRHPALREICASKSAVIQVGDPKHEATMNNHNKLLTKYPYAIGMKTGYTIKAGRCLVSAAEKDGVTLVIASLNGYDYWDDHIAFYEYGFSLTACYRPELPDFSRFPVSGGTMGTVPLVVGEMPEITVLKGEEERVECLMDVPRFLLAPLKEGEQVGTVRYILDGRELCALPITVGQEVPARPVAGFLSRFQELFWALFRGMLDG